MKFYTSVVQDGKYILCRGVDGEGNSVYRKDIHRPRLYMRGESNGPWKNLAGQPLREYSFNDIWEARNWASKYDGAVGSEVYGNQRWQYAYIADVFPGHIEYDPSLIKIATVDIEVDSSNGFPEPDDAEEEVTAITLHMDGQYYTFGTGEFNAINGVNYFRCRDEKDLILKFLEVWEEHYPDIVTGWNCKLFDLPYLINRTIKLFGKDTANKISPWRKIVEEEINIGFRTSKAYEIYGVAILDYQDMYKKFAPNSSQESYKLDHIAHVELGRGKVDYSQYGTLPHEVMAKNYELFIQYNIDDVVLVVGLEKKLKLLELAMTLAYMTKTNFEDVFSQGRMWDTIIFNKLKERHIAVPPQPKGKKESQYAGAYVKEPVSGMYNWIVSFDLTSLYPHLIMMYGLSPETLVQPEEYDSEILHFLAQDRATIEKLLNKQCNLDWLKSRNLTVTPNAQFFRTDIKGFLPEIMEEMFAARSAHKKAELTAKAAAENSQDQAEKDRLKLITGREKAIQSALKVCLNSAYGSIGNAYFRYFDLRIAEAVTLSGQLSIRWIQNAINTWFNKLLKTEGKDFVLASDTDSIYIHMEELLKSLSKDIGNTETVIDLMDAICEKKIKPFIDKSYTELATYVNSRQGKMVMKREALVDKGIWCAKKNYILSVWDMEGLRYKKPEIKITGWAAVRTTTPKVCRDKLKETVAVILQNDEDITRKFVNKFRDEFMEMTLDQIACPSGISEIDMNNYGKLVIPSGTTMHVKAALAYNHYIREYGLTKRYELIKPKGKIKYVLLMEPNPAGVNALAYIDKMPEEFKIAKYIDKEAQFEKVFMSPLKIVLEAIDWDLERTDNILSFFVD